MSDNKYYEKIRKYARRALNSDLKTYIRGRDLYMYGTVDMSEYVKQSVFDDTVEELEGKIQDLDDKKANKSDVYTKSETDDKFLTKDDAANTYQPIGDYLTKDEAATTYQPIGDYATVTYVNNADTLLLNQINLKQDQLTAGLGILIENNVISCTIDTTLYKVVTSLPDKPDEGDENKIFLVPSELQGDKNIYIEYLYVDGAWEKIGEIQTEVDLSDYYTKEEVIALLENYYTKEEVNKLIEAATGGITEINASGTSPLKLSASVSGTVATITGSVDTYSKTEIDNLIASIDQNIEITNEYAIDLYDGVFVVCTRNSDDEFCLARPSAIRDGGFTYHTWLGIAVVENGKMFIISLKNSPVQLPISSSAKLFGTEKALAEAIIDQDGAGNTDLILQASSDECITNTINYAVGYCNAYETSAFPAGSWYLPSFYEFLIIKKYLREINYALSLVGGEPIIYENVAGSGYWTSTEMDANNAWVLNTYETHLTAGSKYGLSRNVRPITMFGHTNNVEPPEPVVITNEIEITSFTYPSQSYTYEAHENIDVSSLTVMLYTYLNKGLISTADVTDSCTLLITPNVDWITVPTFSLTNNTIINISENTTTEQRTGTVHLVATYQGTYTAEADSSIIVQGPKPDEYSYALNIATFQYQMSSTINTIPADGCTDLKPSLAVLLMTINTSTGYTTGTQITPTSSYYTITNSGSIDSSTGAITISSNIAETVRTYTVTGEFKYTAPNGEELEASKSITLTQSAAEVTYSLEITSFTYNGGNNIPAEGGPFYPDLIVALNKQGTTGSTSHVIPDSTMYTMERSDFVELENEGTGLAIWDENPDTNTRSVVFNVQAWYTAPNGEELTAEGGGLIYQDGVDTVITYKNPEIDSLTYPSMPANGGTISPIITYHQDWSDNQGNSGTITNIGAEFNYWFIMSQVNCTIDNSTGDLTTSVVNSSTNIVVVGDVRCFITMNGLNSSTHGITVYQEGAEVDPDTVVNEVKEKLSLDVTSDYRRIAYGATVNEPSTNTNNSVMSDEAVLPAGCQLTITVNQDSFGLRCQEGTDNYFSEPLEKSSASVTVGIFVNGADRPTYSFGGGSITGTGTAGEDSYATCNLSNGTITIPASDEDRVIQLGIAVMSMELRYMCNIYLTTTINVSAEAIITN